MIFGELYLKKDTFSVIVFKNKQTFNKRMNKWRNEEMEKCFHLSQHSLRENFYFRLNLNRPCRCVLIRNKVCKNIDLFGYILRNLFLIVNKIVEFTTPIVCKVVYIKIVHSSDNILIHFVNILLFILLFIFDITTCYEKRILLSLLLFAMIL